MILLPESGVNQRGYRTRLDDASGWTTWAYDTRGRVVSETKHISGAGAFTTQYGYDGLDRVISTTYPTDEVVTQTPACAGTSLGSASVMLSSSGGVSSSDSTRNRRGQLVRPCSAGCEVVPDEYTELGSRESPCRHHQHCCYAQPHQPIQLRWRPSPLRFIKSYKPLPRGFHMS